MLEKSFNLVKEWPRYEVFGVRVFNVLMMGDLKQIRILSLKALIFFLVDMFQTTNGGFNT
jgi:hypothetical protein